MSTILRFLWLLIWGIWSKCTSRWGVGRRWHFAYSLSLNFEPRLPLLFRVVKALIQHSSGLGLMFRQNLLGNTPLHLACLGNNESIVRLLLSRGALLNALNTCQKTPLMCAAENDHRGCCRILIENKCDINVEGPVRLKQNSSLLETGFFY